MLRYWILFLFLCRLYAATNDIEEADGDIEADDDLANYLRETIENFRSQMTKGIPEIKMPVLDPLHLEDMDVNVDENVAKIHLGIKEMLINGLSEFYVINLKPNLEEFYIELNFTIPRINISGEYTLDGKLLSVFPVYGDGNYSITATGLIFGCIGQLRFEREKMLLNIPNMDLHFDEITMDLGDKFLGGGRFGKVMQEVIPGIGRDIFMLYKPIILQELQTALTNKINVELDKPAVKDIIKDIIPLQ